MAARHAGRRVLVTGAARGIGLGIARRFLLEGAHVALADLDAGALDAARADLSTGGDRVLAVRCDVSSESEECRRSCSG